MTATNPAPTTSLVWVDCARCGGAGRFSCYRGIAGGVCFACRGEKGEWVSAATVQRRKQDAARRAKARAAREAKRLADIDARDAAALAQLAPLGFDTELVEAAMRGSDPQPAYQWQNVVYTIRDNGWTAEDALELLSLDPTPYRSR